MHLNRPFLIAAAVAQASTSNALERRQDSDEPCAVAASYMESTTSSSSGQLPPDIAYACLQSVPVDTETDIQLIDEYKTFVEWQSTLSYLKDPPDGYNEEPVDIMAGLDDIRQRLQDNSYSNEFDVQNDIRNLVDSAHDGHFNYAADILNIVTYSRPLRMVSLSSNGLDVPKIYAIEGDSGLIPEEVTQINGEDVTDFLNKVVASRSEMDADARFNGAMLSFAVGSTTSGEFAFTQQYIGDTTNVTLANGTEFSYSNVANIETSFDWTSVTDGASLFEACCTLSSSSIFEKRMVPVTHIKSPHFQVLKERQSNEIDAEFSSSATSLTGYYIDGNSDVAVIRIPSFGAPDSSSVSETEFPFAFQQEMLEFIRQAKSDGKNKMIIDLRGNGGGDGVLGWDAFRAFFPKTEPADVTRFRANENYLLIGEGVSAVLGDENLAESDGAAYTEMQNMRDWNWQVQLKPDGSRYTSGQEMYGPATVHGDNFTNLIRRNLSEPLSYGVSNFTIVGYGVETNAIDQLYQSGDIVMLQDGICHSTCAAFSEFMKNAGRVRSIVVGGRPQTGPMQSVAGTKGGFTFTSDSIRGFANITLLALQYLLPDEADRLGQTSLGDLATTTGQTLDRRQVRAQMNCEDNIQQSDPDMVPLQFVYEAADCRIFYTQAMIEDPMEVWRSAANSIWNGGQCVNESTNHPSSLSGGDDYDPDGNSNQDGQDGEGAAASWGASRGLLILVVCLALGLNLL